ncbi:2-C-methyl-D-erythritol 4-phosphate cytidylyltransferase [Porticoccus litoralis]|uniref:2-C-methyl-D-erythritol 4-phosphate cytidylyltransferase n=1 Tax=Porticoccus litoralis TaxID=434086 RepID=A0AAW8AYB5_9GAMM|nr:2-C-methyl-D-erythritol 4-phosphate cytidylyltransferase [Porticoccus litoralis]MDP1519479.1 2-C-methyl-D-erythritol 4-phosphate cytidylyltransferase [Porticoccus litoralis]TNE87324.1 MAG: 2-C-methyl-D-erythritol 4-phosphate cytidylyltransferase [Gammaproteobacteria bacterium]
MTARWIIVPAAGVGSRFGAPVPKQYQSLAGKTVVEHTLERLLAVNDAIVVVAVHPNDTYWQQLAVFDHPRIRTVHGGKERADSVRLALECLTREAHTDDWILVHDVARPCVRVAEVQHLMQSLEDHRVGGVLAVPVSDTVKRVEQGDDIAGTEDRNKLWLAQTPQMFRYGMLSWSLNTAVRQGWQPTDESAAVERLGHTPMVVEGSRDNIKITRQEDLEIAEAILKYQQKTEVVQCD